MIRKSSLGRDAGTAGKEEKEEMNDFLSSSAHRDNGVKSLLGDSHDDHAFALNDPWALNNNNSNGYNILPPVANPVELVASKQSLDELPSVKRQGIASTPTKKHLPTSQSQPTVSIQPSMFVPLDANAPDLKEDIAEMTSSSSRGGGNRGGGRGAGGKSQASLVKRSLQWTDNGEQVKASLEGPAGKVEALIKFSAKCQEDFYRNKKFLVEQSVPYPIFIVSSLTSTSDCMLNWYTPCALGRDSHAIVLIVVLGFHVPEYRRILPQELFLVLPEENGRSIGYQKNMVKQMASGSTLVGAQEIKIKFPFFWMCDEGLVRFTHLRKDDRQSSGNMFSKAFLATQTRLDIRKYGAIGFLRDDGRPCLITSNFCNDVLAIDRALLINVEKTRSVSYISGTTKYTNLIFLLSLHAANIPTIKVMDFCYRYVRVFCGKVEEEVGESVELVSDAFLESNYDPPPRFYFFDLRRKNSQD